MIDNIVRLIPMRIHWVVGLLCVITANSISQECSFAVEAEQSTVHIEELASAKFQRVNGPEVGGSVLDVGGNDSWRSITVGMPTVDFDGELYRMWFVGGAPTSDRGVPYGWYERIGLATSRDGLHWELANEGKPVFDLGPPSCFDAKGVAHPFVMRVGNEFWMWYGGISGQQAQHLGLEPTHVRVEQIGLAHSKDGIHWQRSGEPVMKIGSTSSIDSIQATGMHIIRKGDEYWMWYGAYNGKHTIAFATSPNGIHWEKANNGQPVQGLEGTEQLGPSVHFDGKRFFMLYGRLWEGGWAQFAAASDDGIHWTSITPGQPLLSSAPKRNFDTGGMGRNYSVHPSQILFVGRNLRVWYMGEDAVSPHAMRVGLMTAPLW